MDEETQLQQTPELYAPGRSFQMSATVYDSNPRELTEVVAATMTIDEVRAANHRASQEFGTPLYVSWAESESRIRSACAVPKRAAGSWLKSPTAIAALALATVAALPLIA